MTKRTYTFAVNRLKGIYSWIKESPAYAPVAKSMHFPPWDRLGINNGIDHTGFIFIINPL